jgi:hypothetical protein
MLEQHVRDLGDEAGQEFSKDARGEVEVALERREGVEAEGCELSRF